MTKSVMIAMGMAGVVYADNTSSHHSLSDSWTGFYAGVEAGFAFNNAELKSQQLGFTDPSETCNTSSDSSTAIPGIQFGYMYQFPNYLVSGIEAAATFNTHQRDILSCNCAITSYASDSFSFKNQMQSSIKGRLGRALNWNNSILLPYLTAGASFADLGLTYKNEGSDYYSKNTTKVGWLIGAGVEWAFEQNWSLRLEYAYVDYGSAINMNIPSIYSLEDPNGCARVNLSSNNVLVALSYWI
ncbi:MAG: outer membrane beta-barrel protein [Gammaproteobacteria bacterium]